MLAQEKIQFNQMSSTKQKQDQNNFETKKVMEFL